MRCAFWLLCASAAAQVAVPYTAIVNDIVVLANGTKQVNGQVTTAVRADGARAIRYERKQGTPSVSRTIDYADGPRVILDEVNQMKSTTRYAGRAKPWLRDARSGCALPGQTFAGAEEVAGYRVARVPDGNTTFWFALEYGCALIRLQTSWGATGQAEQTIAALIPGTPAPGLFETRVPYREVIPSELRRLTSRERPDQRTREILAKEDDWYHQHRP